MGGKDMFISGVFNYCDRWCGRCAFTSRCMLFSMDQRTPGAPNIDEDQGVDQAFREVGAIIASTHAMVTQLARQQGVTEADIADATESLDRQDAIMAGNRLANAMREYAGNTTEWLVRTGNEMLMLRIESSRHAIETLARLTIFIAAKTDRALRSSLQGDVEGETGELNDADGSMKAALIAIDECLTAWATLGQACPRDRAVVSAANHLQELREECERTFPHATRFLRPGLDAHLQ